MNEQTAKKWYIKCLVTLVIILIFPILITIIIDPYFHFHKPLPCLSYRLYEERYINSGIAKHFKYNAIITGSSMTQNFKTSELDAFFGTTSIKLPLSGASYKELSDNLDYALSQDNDIKMVLWALDYNDLLKEYNYMRYDSHPYYLYDNSYWNDISYLLNKDVLYHGILPVLTMTLTGTPSTSMDEYSSFKLETGYDSIMDEYKRKQISRSPQNKLFDETNRETVAKTITYNIINLVNRYPDVDFYIFYPPYSICYWDKLQLLGEMEMQFEATQVATELLLECPNIKLYNFFECYDMICNLNNYSDTIHYTSEINSQILKWISNDDYLVTKDNYLNTLKNQLDFYKNFDYDTFFKEAS